MNSKIFFKYKLHHVLGWFLYLIITSAGYYQFYDNKVQLYLVTSVYALSHALMYYVSQYQLISVTLKRNKPWLFILVYIGLALILAVIMYLAIDGILGEKMSRYFGDDFLKTIPVFLISNLFMGGVLIGIKSLIDKSRHQKLEKEKKQESLMTELSYLKAQVNPHFLFNTINSVYVLIKLNPDKAAEMLIKLSDLLRSQLYDFSTDRISIEEEINYLENYIELEKLRRAHRVEVSFKKEGDLSGFSLPPLLLIPFLENCFKHLSSHTDKPNLVLITIERKMLELGVEFKNTYDNGSTGVNYGGIGLANVKRRLALLFPDQHHLTIKKEEGFFIVNLQLNLHKYE